MESTLKELCIIVRPEKASDTEAILLKHGEYITRQMVTGRGKEMGTKKVRAWFGTKQKSYAYIRKVMLTAWVQENILPRLCKELIQKNQTKQHGDGRIFILPTTIKL